MKRLIKFPSISEFRGVVKSVDLDTKFVRYDEIKNKVIYDHGIKCPIISVNATEKIHGTNAAVCFSNPDGFWVQSKVNVLTPEKDNAGCAFYANSNNVEWFNIICLLAAEHDIDLNENIISVYYEWCGGGIQKKSAVTHLDKRAIIFQHFKVSPVEPDTSIKSKWYETKIGENWVDCKENDIFNICNFNTYEFDIDFSNPLMSVNYMKDLVENTIEVNSPVGQQFGIDGNIGEGMVISFIYKGVKQSFKVKGEKHSKTKVKTLTPVDEAKLQLRQEIAQKVCPAWRLEQMFDEANDTMNSGEPIIENIPIFMKLLKSDIIKEECDIIVSAGMEPKDILPAVSKISAMWYKEQLNILAFK